MPVIEIKEMLGVRSSTIDAQWRRSYRRAWRALTDGPFVGALEVRLACPVALGHRYEQTDASSTVTEHDDFAFATRIDVQIDPDCDDDCSWIVTVEYGPYDATAFPENPTEHPIKISSGANRFEKPCETDTDGNAVVNSAGDYFDPPAVMDASRPTIKVTRNEQTFDKTYADSWRDTVNSIAWNGYLPRTVKILPITAELEYNPVCGFYYVVTYEFEVNEQTWDKVILDQGLRVIGSTPYVQVAATDEDGKDVSSPVLLDGAGAQLAVGSTPAYLTYRVYPEADFTDLNIDFTGAPGQPP